MQHLDEGTIHSWLDGALSADEAARVEAQVAECPQCAAAVAEARGFIAASSRILTALDHVPRGVVPRAHSVKWYNRAGWRAVAAVLVVAVGSLVVFRNGGTNATTTHKPQTSASVEPSTRSAISSGVASSGQSAAEADFSGKSTLSAKQSVAAAPSRVEEVAALDAAKKQLPLKVVGPRVLGAKVTLYEVAPGDTVTFTEALPIQLNAAVTTDISSAESETRRPMEKSAAAAPTRASVPALTVPPLQVEVVNGVTTISWPDVTTGNMLKLSGHIPVERLKEIKLRIERERTLAAAKKRP